MTLHVNTTAANRQVFSQAPLANGSVLQSPARRTATYLVGEEDRSSTRPANALERTTVCINGKWHSMRSDVATFEQIVGLTIRVNPGQIITALSVMFRRGAPAHPSGSLSPGDAIPIVDGMLFNATATVLS